MDRMKGKIEAELDDAAEWIPSRKRDKRSLESKTDNKMYTSVS